MSTVGGGAAPGSAWPTKLIALSLAGVSPDELDRRLRAHSPAVVARIQDQQVVLDLRTVQEEEDAVLADAVSESAQRINAAESDASLSKSPGKTPR